MIHFKKTAWINLNLLENSVKTHFCCFGNIVLRCRWVRGNWWWPEFPRLPGSISMHIWPARFCAPNSPPSGVSGIIPKATKTTPKLITFGSDVFFTGEEGNSPLKTIKHPPFQISSAPSPSRGGASPIYHPRSTPQCYKATKNTPEVIWFGLAVFFVGKEGNSLLKTIKHQSFLIFPILSTSWLGPSPICYHRGPKPKSNQKYPWDNQIWLCQPFDRWRGVVPYTLLKVNPFWFFLPCLLCDWAPHPFPTTEGPLRAPRNQQYPWDKQKRLCHLLHWWRGAVPFKPSNVNPVYILGGCITHNIRGAPHSPKITRFTLGKEESGKEVTAPLKPSNINPFQFVLPHHPWGWGVGVGLGARHPSITTGACQGGTPINHPRGVP